MKFKKDEEKLVSFLKFSPPIFTILFASLVITFIFIINKYNFQQDIKKTEEEFTNTNKQLVKNEVLRVHDYIIHQKAQTKLLLQKNIQENVEIAHKIVSEIYQQNKDKGIEAIKKQVKQTLRNVRFNNGVGYYFIVSNDSKMILHPILPHLEEQDVSNLKEGNNPYLFQHMSTFMKSSQESFYQWYWSKPNSNIKEQKKIGFLKSIPELNWFIGSGYYIDDFESSIKKNLFQYTPNIKFGTNGFIFIIDYNGVVLSHPRRSMIGKNVLNQKDKRGKYFIKDMINIAKHGEGFLTYVAPSNSIKANFTKTSYIKGVEGWNFLIGAGYYNNELNEKVALKKEVMNKANDEYLFNLLIISFVLTIILTIIALYISKIVQERFLQYKHKIEQEIKKNQEKDILLAQQSKMAAMGEMIGNIAHQWRQPLSTITTAASGISLKHEYQDLSDKDFKNFTQLIEENARFLSETIDDFKEFFNPNKVKVHFKIEDAINRTINIVSAQYASQNINIIKHIENRTIYCLENELIQIIINILNNARDALEEKKIGKKLIIIDAYSTKNHLVIDITDNARGIDEAIIGRIFEPYFTTKFKSNGIGIGLYMCYEIMTKHLKGTIRVKNVAFECDNTQYQGAKFSIKIPLKEIEKQD